MVNETIRKFGYPASLLKEYADWVVLLRPKQVTLGCVVLACKQEARSLGEVSPEAYASLSTVTADLEQAIRASFNCDKFNYLALMMVDPHVHFHVVPRYGSPRVFQGINCADPGWPKHPDMNSTLPLDPQAMSHMQTQLAEHWPSR